MGRCIFTEGTSGSAGGQQGSSVWIWSRISHLGNPFWTRVTRPISTNTSLPNHEATARCLTRIITDPSTTTTYGHPCRTPASSPITAKAPKLSGIPQACWLDARTAERILPNLELSRKTGPTTLDILSRFPKERHAPKRHSNPTLAGCTKGNSSKRNRAQHTQPKSQDLMQPNPPSLCQQVST